MVSYYTWFALFCVTVRRTNRQPSIWQHHISINIVVSQCVYIVCITLSGCVCVVLIHILYCVTQCMHVSQCLCVYFSYLIKGVAVIATEEELINTVLGLIIYGHYWTPLHQSLPQFLSSTVCQHDTTIFSTVHLFSLLYPLCSQDKGVTSFPSLV